jgi:hypothetical protein
MKHMIESSILIVLVVFLISQGRAFGHEGEDHGKSKNEEMHKITGEVVDLMCYIDHGAVGEKHAQCARTCIESGGPVGLLTKDGNVYLVIGEHKPINKKLVPLAAKTITLKGKVVERGGMKMIENAEIVK